MNNKYVINDSTLNAYKDTLTLAKTQLISLGGDNRDDPYGDKIQGGLLTIIDAILKNMDDVKNNPANIIKI